MPAAKNTTIRYHIINHCLRSKGKKYWSTEDLIRKIGEKDIRISARTLRNDIEAMRNDDRLGFGACIDYCKTNKGYYYSDPNFSITNVNFSEEQIEAFDFVITSLHEFEDLKVMQEFKGAIDKLAGVFAQVMNPRSAPYLEFEKAPYYKGLEWRDELLKAIRNKKVLEIKYTTFGREYPLRHVVHPYLLKEYKNRWYLLGLLNRRKVPITLALDRINSIQVTDHAYLENTFFDTREYFNRIIGITHAEGEPEEIVLHCSPSLANYIKSQHLHVTQRILHEDKTGIQVQLTLIPNYELVSTILGHGKDIKVLKPESLRERVKVNLMESLARYE